MLSPAAWLALALTAAYFCSGVHFYDYCKMEVNCSKGKHIACHPEQMFSKSGRGVPTKNWTRIVMTKELRQVLIDAHNEKRNAVACGDGAIKDKDGKTYPKATRMRELVWDTELEYIARMHADQCIFAHDDCRLSSKYRHAGQNLAMRMSTSASGPAIEAVLKFVNAWFVEFKDCAIGEVDAVGSTSTDKQIGHFTVMMNERVTKLGCALTRCVQRPEKNQKYMLLLTCDYSFTNMKRLRMYTKGNSAASKCDEVKSTKSARYKCLCAHSDYQL